MRWKRRIFVAIAVLTAFLGLLVLKEWIRLPNKVVLEKIFQSSQIKWEKDQEGGWHPKCRAGINVRLQDVPNAVQALIATEDRRFRSHPGIDLLAGLRAFWVNLRAGGVVQGASTIPMQVSKFLILNSSRGYKRKFLELILALKISKSFSKDEILEVYLNHADFGSIKGRTITGIEQAARGYYRKRARDLTLLETAILIGALQNPNLYHPRRDASRALKRGYVVLNNMVDAGFISVRQMDRARASKIVVGNYSDANIDCRWFADWVKSHLQRKNLVDDLSTVRVITTFSATDQLYAELAVSRAIKFGRKRNAGDAALVAMAPDGAVSAMVGGANYGNRQFNIVTSARRQVGSVIKPLIYAAALESKKVDMKTMVLDGPIKWKGWAPKNYDGKYRGMVDLHTAIVYSINSVSIKITQKIGLPTVIKTFRKFGITQNVPMVPSIALGAFEVRPIEIVGAYASFSNGGYRVKPYGVRGIIDNWGNVISWKSNTKFSVRTMTSGHCKALDKALKGVLRVGTAKGHAFSWDAAGKSGTTQNFRDAWFIGYTPNLIAGVWLGNVDGAPMAGVVGGGVPAAVWENFMANAHISRGNRYKPSRDWKRQHNATK